MNSARSCPKLIGFLAVVVLFAGCGGGGGPEAFAPGSASMSAPVATNAHEPISPGSPAPASQRRFKQKSTQTAGPQEQP